MSTIMIALQLDNWMHRVCAAYLLVLVATLPQLVRHTTRTFKVFAMPAPAARSDCHTTAAALRFCLDSHSQDGNELSVMANAESEV